MQSVIGKRKSLKKRRRNPHRMYRRTNIVLKTGKRQFPGGRTSTNLRTGLIQRNAETITSKRHAGRKTVWTSSDDDDLPARADRFPTPIHDSSVRRYCEVASVFPLWLNSLQ